MMAADDLFGLTSDQHAELGALAIASRTTLRPQAGVTPKKRRQSLAVRVMEIGETHPDYNPIETREVALFVLNRTGIQKTVKFYGEDLEGDVLLTIDGDTYRIDCQATTDELRAAVGYLLRDCRATAFPGLWEFAYSGDDAHDISAVPYVPSSGPFFDGGIVVINEGWVSVTADGENFSTVDVIDGIQHLQGEVKRGATAIASPLSESLWIAGHWSCPAFTFA